MATSEFTHYAGCKHNDPDNCSACALTDTRQDQPNYAGWPLAYMENGRTIPAKWRKAFQAELNRTDNMPYVNNLRRTMARCGVAFSDGLDQFGGGDGRKVHCLFVDKLDDCPFDQSKGG